MSNDSKPNNNAPQKPGGGKPSAEGQNKSGFTLIEFMIVVAIIVIVALIAYPMYQKYRAERVDPQANQMVEKSLRGLAEAEKLFHATASRYTNNLANLAPLGFLPDPNIIYGPITLDGDKWTAVAKHQDSSGAVRYSSDGGVSVLTGAAGDISGKLFSAAEIEELKKVSTVQPELP